MFFNFRNIYSSDYRFSQSGFPLIAIPKAPQVSLKGIYGEIRTSVFFKGYLKFRSQSTQQRSTRIAGFQIHLIKNKDSALCDTRIAGFQIHLIKNKDSALCDMSFGYSIVCLVTSIAI